MFHNRVGWILPMAGLLLLAGVLQAAETRPAVTSDGSLANQINLDKFRLIAVQHDGRFKTFDTLARSILRLMSRNEVLKRPAAGADKPVTQDAVFTYLDLMFNPAAYQEVRLLHVKETEVRKQLVSAAQDRLDEATRKAILKDGLVSAAFLQMPEVQHKLDELSRDIMRTAKKVENLRNAFAYMQRQNLQSLMRVIPPSRAESIQERWYSIGELKMVSSSHALHAGMGEISLPGMDFGAQQELTSGWMALEKAWKSGDAAAINTALDTLADTLARVAPQVYPPLSKLSLEHWYYKYNKMMWSWAFYFIAFVLLLMGMVYCWPRATRAGVVFFALGFALHTAACGIRWYLAGRIPNTNMFEAVTAAAWFGAAVAIFLELGPIVLRRVRNDTAMSFAGVLAVGGFAVWLSVLLVRGTPIDAWQQWGPVPIAGMIIGSVGCMGLISLVVAGRMARYQGLLLLVGSAAGMVALMCGQFMKVSLDSDIGRTMPVLNDLWLYIHTNMIIASYALIGMAFVTAALYVVGRMLTRPFADRQSLWAWGLLALGTVAIPLVALLPEVTIKMIMSAWAPFLLVWVMFLVAAIARLVWRKGAQQAYAAWEGLPLGMAGAVGGSARLTPGAVALSALNPAAVQPAEGTERREGLAKIFDGATMLLLELSFIMLWTGIIMGAVWADHSWGRPWGWDPKEVFALNTWIIFLILVHVRLKVKDRELWTAVLAVIGTSVMMFNWVVVNFFIVGLHSYA